MRTLNISISDYEFDRLGLKGDSLSFTDFVDILSREIAKQRLRNSVNLAETYKLSEMSLADIDDEVKATRKDAKNHR